MWKYFSAPLFTSRIQLEADFPREIVLVRNNSGFTSTVNKPVQVNTCFLVQILIQILVCFNANTDLLVFLIIILNPYIAWQHLDFKLCQIWLQKHTTWTCSNYIIHQLPTIQWNRMCEGWCFHPFFIHDFKMFHNHHTEFPVHYWLRGGGLCIFTTWWQQCSRSFQNCQG